MDRLAACHSAHGFLHVHGRKHRHGFGSGGGSAHQMTGSYHAQYRGGRSLSLNDRRGLISPFPAAARGLISPLPSSRRHSWRRLHDMSAMMQAMDYDHFDDPIGQILMPMKNVKFDSGSSYTKHMQGKPNVQKEKSGEMLISLCYLPDANKITVGIIKAKDLPKKEVIGTNDPYVKLWLVHAGAKLEKHKTTIKPQTLSPVYNESFQFNVPAKEKLENELNLVATIMDYDLIHNNEEIGHVILGPLGGELGHKHWKDMIEKPEKPNIMWHQLSAHW